MTIYKLVLKVTYFRSKIDIVCGILSLAKLCYAFRALRITSGEVAMTL